VFFGVITLVIDRFCFSWRHFCEWRTDTPALEPGRAKAPELLRLVDRRQLVLPAARVLQGQVVRDVFGLMGGELQDSAATGRRYELKKTHILMFLFKNLVFWWYLF